MPLAVLKDQMPANSCTYNSVRQFQQTSFRAEALNMLSNYPSPVEIRECSIAVVIPSGIEGIEPVKQQMVLNDFMAQMSERFNGASLLSRSSRYKNSVSQGFCRQELMVKSWATQELLVNHFEEILQLVSWLGRTLQQKKMTILVEGLGEQLMIRPVIDMDIDHKEIA